MEQTQDLVNELSYLCNNIGEKFFHLIHKRPMRVEGLSISQLKVLTLLRRKGDFKMKEITEELGIASSSATELIDKLIKEKFVERFRAPDDRRVVRVKLTEEGKNLINEACEVKRKFWATMIENFNEEEKHEFLTFSRKMYKIVCKMTEEEIYI